MNGTSVGRRDILMTMGLGALAGTFAGDRLLDAAESSASNKPGDLKQSVCRWCYGRMSLEELAGAALRIGYKSIELLGPQDVLKIKPMGLTCAVLGGADIVNGLNRRENHPKIIGELKERILFCAQEGVPNVICMSGNRTIKGKTISDEEGLENCAQGLKEVVGLAEKQNVTIVMEGLNSKVDHKDYMYDRTEWGVALCKKVGSPRFKLLYDIYHMQIMEGDVIATIRKYKDFIGHYHTGGVPGRHEIDDTQELNYPAIVRAILATGFQGYLAQEYIPVKEPIAALELGFKICNV